MIFTVVTAILAPEMTYTPYLLTDEAIAHECHEQRECCDEHCPVRPESKIAGRGGRQRLMVQRWIIVWIILTRRPSLLRRSLPLQVFTEYRSLYTEKHPPLSFSRAHFLFLTRAIIIIIIIIIYYYKYNIIIILYIIYIYNYYIIYYYIIILL